MVPLKVTSEYSLLKSLIKVNPLIDFLLNNNIKSCALVDTELFGAMEFYYACKNNGIKPIIGLEVIIDDNSYYLYPKNALGYKKLLKINTLKFNKLSTKDILDDEILIIIPYKSIKAYELFDNKDNIYLGYSNDNEKKNVMLLTGKIVYFNNIRSFTMDDLKYLKYLELIGEKIDYTNDDYFKLNISNEDEKTTHDFAMQIDLDFSFNERYIPKYKENVNSIDYLTNLANVGLNKRFNNNPTKEYKDRLEEELKVINELGFTDYFLIVYDYVLYAKKNDILVGPGRGSASGSLVSYSLGITDIDPIKYNLLFARFLNPYRKKMPDIDIDFEDTKRHLVIDYVKNKYGEDKVALGITFNTLKCKLALRDLASKMKIDTNLFEKFIKCIDGSKSLKDNKNDNILKYLKMYKELNELYTAALKIEGLKKNISTHAAGVVISSKSLDEIIPIYNDNGVIKTGYAMEYLEGIGLLKMDFLALKNLSTIRNIIKYIPGFNINDILLDDVKTYEIFKNADTDNIFQFESNYAKTNLLKLNVSSFNELAIAISLVRPGPSDQIDNYVLNKEKGYSISEKLKPILDETYGIIIFQEQVMKIFEVIGGYTSYEADSIRVSISKKKGDLLNEEMDNFVERAVQRGYQKEYAISLKNKIIKFAEYGFNKSHAVSYAKIAYIMAYLKAHYKEYFIMAILNDTKDSNVIKKNLDYLKRYNIKVLKPNINVSNEEYRFKNGSLLLPITIIKSINKNILISIIQNKKEKYTDIFDFFTKNKDILDKKTYESLIRSSLLDIFDYNRSTLLNNYDLLYNYSLLGDESEDKPILKEYPDYTISDYYNDDIISYGFSLSYHPCQKYNDVIKVKDSINYLFKNIDMALLVEKVKYIKTKKGDDMAFLEVSDETGVISATVFADALKSLPNIKKNDIILINGKSSKRFAEYQIIINKIKKVLTHE